MYHPETFTPIQIHHVTLNFSYLFNYLLLKVNKFSNIYFQKFHLSPSLLVSNRPNPMDSAPSTAKLRLMCSYGGHILPRPGTHSLFYAGGDTRILSIPRRTLATLSSFHSHLSTLLSLQYPFTLKYQLPHLHLDSLISLASDEDLHILVDEHHRSSSRIRLFVFPAFRHPKSESWFLDALKSSSIMQDTASSFGSSSSSSASFTPRLPPPLHDHHFPSSSHSLPRYSINQLSLSFFTKSLFFFFSFSIF